MSRLLDFAGAVAYTGLTERYLRRLVFERRIPHFKDRRRIFFSREDLDHFIEGLRVPARSEDELTRRRTAR